MPVAITVHVIPDKVPDPGPRAAAYSAVKGWTMCGRTAGQPLEPDLGKTGGAIATRRLRILPARGWFHAKS